MIFPSIAATGTPENFAEGAFGGSLDTINTLGQSGLAGIDQSFGLGTALRDINTPGLAEVPGGRAQRGGAARYLTQEEVQAQGDKLFETPEDYKVSPYYRDSVPFEKGMTESRAKALAGYSDLQAVRDYYGSKRPLTAFFGRLAGQAVDPLNYIPIFGEVEAPLAFGRVAGRALIGAGEAATNTAVMGSLSAPERARLGYDTSWSGLAGDIAFSAMAGGIVGGAAGYFGRAASSDINLRAIPETQANRTKAAIVLNDAIDSHLNAGEVKLGPNSRALIGDMAQSVERQAHPVTVEERNGQLWFEGQKSDLGVPSGQLSARERGDALEITTARVRQEAQGQGIGKDLYRNAIDYAAERGKTIQSAPSVSESAARIYEGLKREGYQVEKNAAIATVKTANGEKHLVSEDSTKPVYSVVGRPKGRTSTKAESAPSLIKFLLSKGGVQEYKGELRATGVHPPALIRSKGMKLDYAREAAVEEGFLPRGADISDLLTAIENEARGKSGLETTMPVDQAKQERAGLSGYLDEIGLTEADWTPDVLWRAKTLIGRGQDPERAFDIAIAEDMKAAADAEDRVASVQSGDPVTAQLSAAKAMGIDPETGQHDLDPDIQQLRERGVLTAEDERALKAEDETVAAAQAWGDVLEAARMCIK